MSAGRAAAARGGGDLPGLQLRSRHPGRRGGRSGGEAVPVWHQESRPRGLRRGDPPGRLLVRRLPAGRRDGRALAGDGARSVATPKRAGRCSGSATGSRCCCEVGLLPGAMLMNRTLRFICRDVHLRVERDGLPLLGHARRGQVLRLPIAHKEGNWFAAARGREGGGVRRGRGTALLRRPTARWTTRPTRTGRSTPSPAS